MQHLRSLLALALVPALAHADVVVVDAAGGGDFTDLQAAIDFAADGDVLLVRDGSYDAPTISARDLVLVADAGATAILNGATFVGALGQDQTLVLSGLELQGGIYDPALSCYACEGSVRIQDCLVRGWDGEEFIGDTGQYDAGTALELYNCRDVALVGCDLAGGDGGDHVAGTSIGEYAGHGGRGIASTMTMLTVYRCTVRGGDGGDTPTGGWGGFPGAGLAVQNAGACTVVQSLFQGGDGGDGGDFIGPSCSDGAPGVQLAVGNSVRELGCVFQGGAAGAYSLPGNCVAGNPTVGDVLTMSGSPRALVTERVVRVGAAASIDLFGQPGDVVRVYQSDVTDAQRRFAASGVWMLGGLPYTTFGPTGTVPGAGSFSVPLAVVAPAGDAEVLYLQAPFSGAQGPVLSNFAVVVVLAPVF
jgi:hypothetical protein